VQTSTHDVVIDGDVVRKRFLPDHDVQAEREWACLEVLAEHAPGLAPRPIDRYDDGGLPAVVMERLPGVPLGDARLATRQTTALGDALRRLYDVPVDAVRVAGIAERRYGHATQAPMLLEWLGDPHDVALCRDPRVVTEAVDAARAWLADPPLPAPRVVVLGIADLNPANVLWDGEVCRLVDFEDGGLSDPAYELADHVEHLGTRLPRLYDPAGLVDAVGLDADDRERLAAYRPLWAVFWLAMLLPGNGGWHRNPPGTTEAQAEHFLALVREH